ncbi:MAG: hypothetical protein ABIN18_01140 [Pseudomonadota bacterium]
MSNKSLNNQLEILSLELDKAHEALEELANQRAQAFDSVNDARKRMNQKKRDIEIRRIEREELIAQVDDQKKQLLNQIRNEIERKSRDKENIQLKINARELYLKPIRERKNKFRRLCEEKERLDTTSDLLKKTANGLNSQNYKIFLGLQNPPFPLDGTYEEKLKWAEAFGKFMKAFK